MKFVFFKGVFEMFLNKKLFVLVGLLQIFSDGCVFAKTQDSKHVAEKIGSAEEMKNFDEEALKKAAQKKVKDLHAELVKLIGSQCDEKLVNEFCHKTFDVARISGKLCNDKKANVFDSFVKYFVWQAKQEIMQPVKESEIVDEMRVLVKKNGKIAEVKAKIRINDGDVNFNVTFSCKDSELRVIEIEACGVCFVDVLRTIVQNYCDKHQTETDTKKIKKHSAESITDAVNEFVKKDEKK